MASSFWEREKKKTQGSMDNLIRGLGILPKATRKASVKVDRPLAKKTELSTSKTRQPSTQTTRQPKRNQLTKTDCENHIKAAYYKLSAEMERAKNSLEYSGEIFDEEVAMCKYSKGLDNQHCPECHYDFGKPLSRGKECPNCHQKLRVRDFRLVGPTYLNKLDSIYQRWRKYFEASTRKQWFDNRMKWEIPIDPMEALANIAESYEKLEDYDSAWRIFSGIEVPTLDIWHLWVSSKKQEKDCSDDDMLYIEFWRAEFLNRRYDAKTWKTSLEQVVDAYINVIMQAQDMQVSLQCHSVLQSITKLSVLYQEPEEHSVVKEKLLANGILDQIK